MKNAKPLNIKNKSVYHMLTPSEICKQVLKLDRSIRFAGIADKMGKIMAAGYREGTVPLLTTNELEAETMKAVLRMKTHEDVESKIGKPIYTYALYKKVRRASIELGDTHQFSLLMISFDIKSDHEAIILDKILPFVKRKFYRAP